MEGNGEAFKGITAPMSLKLPTELDLSENKNLLEAIKSLDVFETEDGNRKRAMALLALQEEAREWIIDLCTSQAVPQHLVEKAGGKIYTFGSYRLGVNTKGADVDALLVAPSFVNREDFFDGFYDRLSVHPDTEDVHCVTDAFVPIMKLKFRGIEIDLLFASMVHQVIPDDFDIIRSMEMGGYDHLDDRGVRSLNGVRVTEAILGLVPDVGVFKTSLKAIRTWAKRKQLYSNALGFPGGVSWAILTARICQLFPKACAAVIVQKFFFVLNQWEWPRPILITRCNSMDFLESWQVMPIITPAEPPQNSTYNVTASSLKVIKKAFVETVETIKAIYYKKASWSNLFTPADFFGTYKHFIHILAEADDNKSFLEISGLVESRIRHLVIALDKNSFVEIAHINTHGFGRASETRPFVKKWFIGLQFRKPRDVTQPDGTVTKEQMNVDLTGDIHYFIKNTLKIHHDNVKAKTNTPYLEQLPVDVQVKYVKRSNLSEYLSREDMASIRTTKRRVRSSNSVSSTTSSRRNSVENGSPSGALAAEKRKMAADSSHLEDAKRQVSESSDDSPMTTAAKPTSLEATHPPMEEDEQSSQSTSEAQAIVNNVG